MKIIDRYLLSEYLKAVIYCLLLFSIIFILWDLLSHLSKFIQAGASFILVIKFYIFMLAPAMVILAPASLMLATLYTLWQFTRSNQLIAMRACGMSIRRIMAPFLFVGILFSIGITLINETIVPNWALWAQEFRANKYVKNEYSYLNAVSFNNKRDKREWSIGSVDINKPNVLYGVTITQERTVTRKEREVYAEKAEWLDGQWWLFDYRLRGFSEDGGPLGGYSNIPYSVNGTCFKELSETPQDIMSDVKPFEFLSSFEIYRTLRRSPDISNKAKAEKRFALHNRIAMPWSCFVVIFFGIPIGAKTSRQSIVNTFLLAMGFFIGFYILYKFGMVVGKQKGIPWLGAWLSNIVFFTIGLIMSFRIK